MIERTEVRIVVKEIQMAAGQLDLVAEIYPLPADHPQVGQNGPPPAPKGKADTELMTEPQRRYLFRLLAAQGVEGQAAERHLREYFRVRELKEVTRQVASQYIDQLVRDQKESGGGKA
jgi:hypothetical protein